MALVRWLRRLLRFIDRGLAARDRLDAPFRASPPAVPTEDIEAFLRSLDLPDDAREYLEVHMHRIVRTLTLVPPPHRGKQALELGTYMQMAPVLGCLFGYEEVRGAYLGPLGRSETRVATAGGSEIFRCQVDSFDVDRDRFPYEDGRFEAVLACEVLEHLLFDPMHMLVETHRVLDDKGTLILTTPNAVSYTAVARVLARNGNPQMYSKYPNPHGENRDTEVPHVREYAPNEVRAIVESAGFEIEFLFTGPMPRYDAYRWVHPLLERSVFPTALRGEQMYCVARKSAAASVNRYPGFLYDR